MQSREAGCAAWTEVREQKAANKHIYNSKDLFNIGRRRTNSKVSSGKAGRAGINRPSSRREYSTVSFQETGSVWENGITERICGALTLSEQIGRLL
jgi:hypothetical protein